MRGTTVFLGIAPPSVDDDDGVGGTFLNSRSNTTGIGELDGVLDAVRGSVVVTSSGSSKCRGSAGRRSGAVSRTDMPLAAELELELDDVPEVVLSLGDVPAAVLREGEPVADL